MTFCESSETYKVTAIVSVYKAERFLKACLEDLIAQSIFPQTEIIIIDAHSPENEQAIAKEFAQKYQNIKYIRTTERETLYASWNRGIKMAKGSYITNANADDRHAPHAFERLAKELDTHSDVALVYADCRITHQVNAHFQTAPVVGYLRCLPYDYINLLRHCEVGPQPMWRRTVHEKAGFFDESYVSAGDYDMWLRMAEYYPFRHVPEDLGIFLQYENNLGSQNVLQTHLERIRAQKRALEYFMNNDAQPTPSFEEQRDTHKQRLLRYICNMENGAVIKKQNKLAYHVYAYVLLSLKLRAHNINMQDVLQSINDLPLEVDVNYLKRILTA